MDNFTAVLTGSVREELASWPGEISSSLNCLKTVKQFLEQQPFSLPSSLPSLPLPPFSLSSSLLSPSPPTLSAT